jgi:dephospho-CoA kinase
VSKSSNSQEVEFLVGISGRTGSGKSTLAGLLNARGFVTVAFRAVLEELLRVEGKPITRNALRDLGGDVRHSRGQRWLEERVGDAIDGASAPRVAVDGLRFPEDHEFFAERYGGCFVHLEASEDARLQRFTARGGTAEEFRSALDHVTEASIDATGRLADFTLANDGSVRDLEQSLVRLPLIDGRD